MGARCSALRIVVVLFAAAFLAMTGISAQIPGQNINIVSKDPHLGKQNEPSLAMGTLNPCHVLGGGNDYRTVYLAGLPDDKEVGDAWAGVYQSVDCGQTWLAGLMPGYPQDKSAEGLASPASGFGAAADATVRAGFSGYYAYSYIVFNRGTNLGRLLLSRFIDPNNIQVNVASITAPDPVQVPIEAWPIQYIGPTLTVDGTSGQFLDKPHMMLSPGTGTCTFPYKEPDPANPGQFVTKTRTIPATVVHLVWTTFLNNSPQPDGKVITRVNYNRSSDCGATLDGPTKKLSETYAVNQGASVAFNHLNGHIYVAWRNFTPDFVTSQVLFSKSTDGGKQFSAPTPIPSLAGLSFFDQNTSTDPPRFRTIAYPTTAFDHNGKFYLAMSVRQNNLPQRSARIVYTTTTDGTTWTMPRVIAPSFAPGNPSQISPEHQIMPAMTYGAGKLQMVWYDFIDDASQVFTTDVNDGHIYAGAPPRIRHTIDVRGAQGLFDQAGNLTFNTYGVLQLPGLRGPKISQYLLGTNDFGPLQQMQSNRSNLKLYCGGGCPFIGDYIDVAALQYVPQTPEAAAASTEPVPPNWVFNGPATADSHSKDFHAAWTDNRDAIVDSVFADTQVSTIPYNSIYNADFSKNLNCNATLTKSRNANIYTARMTPGLSLLLPVNAKPVDAAVPQRSFPFTILNGTSAPISATIAIANQPAGGSASFAQFSSVTTIVVDMPAHSSAARTVYVSSAAQFAPVRIVATAGPTLNAAAVINPDATNPTVFGSLAAGETHEPGIANPDLDNPDLDNPDLDNPDLDNPDLDNPDLDNPDLDNPDLDNPDLDNPDLDNPDLDNATLVEGAVNDTTYVITNGGNDAAVYQIDMDITGKKTDPYYFQLFARRVYKLPSTKDCNATQTGQNQVIFNIASPDTTVNAFQDPNSQSAKNATVLLMPGESIRLTLRVRPKDSKTPKFCPFADADGGCTAKSKTHTIVVKVKAHAANTGETVPRSATFSIQ